MWWGLEVPWWATCLEVGTGQSEGGCDDSVMLVTPIGPWEQIDLQAQHPGNGALLCSSSAPLAFHVDFHECPFSKPCYMWTKLGLCSLQPNESNQNILSYLCALYYCLTKPSVIVSWIFAHHWRNCNTENKYSSFPSVASPTEQTLNKRLLEKVPKCLKIMSIASTCWALNMCQVVFHYRFI